MKVVYIRISKNNLMQITRHQMTLEEIRIRRAKELETKPAAVIPVRFKMEPVKKVSEDPFEQAAYAYGLIESVVETDGRE